MSEPGGAIRKLAGCSPPRPAGAAWVAAGCLLWVGPLACAREAGRLDAAPSRAVGVPGPDTIDGRVRLVGNTPFVRTVLKTDGGGVAVVGQYAAEVGRLSGAVVRVSGERQTGGLGPEIRASSYEILAIDGERPRVGILTREGEAWQLVGPDGSRLALRAVPERLSSLRGARVWVVANDDGVVIRYGVLRSAPVQE